MSVLQFYRPTVRLSRLRLLILQFSNKVNPPDDKMMIDPFEVRMRFTTQLQHLSAAVTSSQKAAHYALKYRDLDEDLHSCILEQLERVRGSDSHRVGPY